MFKFFRDAQAELEHVVWPTQNETKKYMSYNISVIVALSLFLMVLGFILQTSLSATRDLFPHDPLVVQEDTVTRSELDDITQAIEKKRQSDAIEADVSTDTLASPDVEVSDVVVETNDPLAQ